MSLLTDVCIGTFVLTLWGILIACGARFFADLPGATLELGVGPKLLIVDLNRFRYRIKLLPLLLFRITVASRLRRSQSITIYAFSIVGLMLTSVALICAALFLASRASSRLPQVTESYAPF